MIKAIGERLLCCGKRVDNGETIIGYYAMVDGACFINDYKWVPPEVEVDPTTVEPISAPIIVIPSLTPGYSAEYRCPNCNAWFNEIRKVGDVFYGSTPYCGNCGQCLDWNVREEGEVK